MGTIVCPTELPSQSLQSRSQRNSFIPRRAQKKGARRSCSICFHRVPGILSCHPPPNNNISPHCYFELPANLQPINNSRLASPHDSPRSLLQHACLLPFSFTFPFTGLDLAHL